jgi:hypothetical protein
MNDFLFLMLIENVKTQDLIPEGQRAWFSIVPESWREAIVTPTAARWGIDRWAGAFLICRVTTAAIFLALALYLAYRWWRQCCGLQDVQKCLPHDSYGTCGLSEEGVRAFRAESLASLWLECVMLTLAWFWLLSPTQNPWYWIWVLPLLPWARSRVWLALSGLVLLYYLRFWLGYHFPDTPVFHTTYVGFVFFDLVVTWLEFGPWLACLAVGYLLHRGRAGGDEFPQATAT